MRAARVAGLVASCVVLGAAASCSAPPSSSEIAQSSGEALHALDDQEQAFLTLINDYRKSQGLAPLVATPLLNQIAYDHSADMAKNNYFDHNDQQGHSPFDRMKSAGYEGGYEAENIAAGNADAQGTFTQWKNSAGHDANMLGTHYVAIGIGRAYAASATYGWYWTTDFGDVVDSSVGATPPDAGAPDSGGGSIDAAPPPAPPSGCAGTTGTPSQSYATPTPLGAPYCASLTAAGEQDWFGWSVAGAGDHYDVKLVTSGDAQLALWKLVSGRYSRVPNTSPTEVTNTSTAAGSYVVRVTSSTKQAQSFSLTLTK